MMPYYQDKFATIYHGDCREILPHLPKADLVLTDPPYGIRWKRGVNNARNSKAHVGIVNDHDTTTRDEALALLPQTQAIVFGSFYAPFPLRLKQVLVWHKPSDSGLVGSTTGYRRDAEPIFLLEPWPISDVHRSSVLRVYAGQSKTVTETGHPHTKPLPLIVWLLEACSAQIILDPFMGSGTTLRAAKDLQRKSIGIEIEECYCEIAANRLRQEMLDFTALSEPHYARP